MFRIFFILQKRFKQEYETTIKRKQNPQQRLQSLQSEWRVKLGLNFSPNIFSQQASIPGQFKS